jgi:hypothetical protein
VRLDWYTERAIASAEKVDSGEAYRLLIDNARVWRGVAERMTGRERANAIEYAAHLLGRAPLYRAPRHLPK